LTLNGGVLVPGTGGGGGGGGGTTATQNIAAPGGTFTDGGATVNTTYVVAAGTYPATIAGFGTGDKIDLFNGFAFTVVPDTDQADGQQQFQAADAVSGGTTTITLTGLTAAQDAALFNLASFDTVFGAGTIF